MNIGTLKANAEGVLIGRVSTMAFSATLALRAFESTNERAPKFDLMALSVDRRSWVKVGALWEYSSNETGECFLSGTIDDPSLVNPIPIALFRQNDGSMNVAWRRPKQKASLGGFAGESENALPPLDATGDEPTGPASSGVDSTPASGDGLGESTAPAPKGKAKVPETAGA
ncbi:DUF736 domain-containing protein [Erythrobacter donghaensis]|jgi:uncharacterized protein (DUF736 family)|uniref:DUF736 domain-containing protein n=1 Tax=Erythrobacter donghaensis TaxID=267135 RepID=UPI00093A7984|nr:DUF736 domain-containing protein [Erythrobacter donghaensis]